MTRRLLAIGILGLLLAHTSAAAQERQEPKFHVAIAANQPTYRLSDTVNLRVDLVNDDNDDLFLYSWLGWSYAWGLVLHIEDTHGRPVDRGAVEDFIPPPPKDATHFARLVPGTYLGTVRHDPVKYLFPRPGHYVVYVTYSNVFSGEFAFGLRVLPFKKDYESNRVAVTVLP